MLGTYGLVAIGGALGSVLRAAGSALGVRLFGSGFPVGTIAINALGSFAIGVLAIAIGPSLRAAWAEDARVFAMIGVCGGFTTFSSFSLQTVELMRQGRTAAAFGNVALSVVICLAATSLGMTVARGFAR